MVERVKAEHVVPQFYLRRWTNARGKLYVFDKPSGTVFPSVVRGVAAETRFYDDPEAPTGVPDDQQLVEKYLSKLEGDFKPVFDSFVSQSDMGFVLSESIRETMALFITVQVIRTDEARKGIEQTVETLTQVLDGEHPTPELREQVRRARAPSGPAFVQLGMLTDSAAIHKMANVLLNHIWVLGVNESTTPLCTSDHPVVREASIRDGHNSYLGLASPGIRVSLPVSPKYILLLRDRGYFSRLRSLDGGRVSLSGREVEQYNSLQVLQANRQVFSSRRDFGLATELKRKYPDQFTLERPRVTANRGRRNTAAST